MENQHEIALRDEVKNIVGDRIDRSVRFAIIKGCKFLLGISANDHGYAGRLPANGHM